MAQASLKIGNKAPAFTLRNQDESKTSLKELAGRWVVLYFYPKDDTPAARKKPASSRAN